MDKKRGQVTIFVILGIVIVALIVLFLAFRKDILPPSSQSGINSEMRAAKKMIENCLEASADDHIRTIGIQGGYLTPGLDTFRLWNDTKISYLCFNLEGKITCRNRLLTLRSMEEQLSRAIEKDLVTCVDLDEIRGVEVIANEPFKVTTQILPYQVAIDLNYPVTINAKLSEASATQRKFSYLASTPLGNLYEVALDILDYETGFGRFDQLSYMLLKLSKYTIYVKRPYPDKIYQLKLRDEDYMFQFAVEGEPS